MKPDPELVYARVRALVEYLRSFEGEDQQMGLQAAQIIEEKLTLVEAQPEFIPGAFDSDLGGKGMLDWSWSDAHRKHLERFSDEIARLSKPRWWHL